jgi:hypothetical protein
MVVVRGGPRGTLVPTRLVEPGGSAYLPDPPRARRRAALRSSLVSSAMGWMMGWEAGRTTAEAGKEPHTAKQERTRSAPSPKEGQVTRLSIWHHQADIPKCTPDQILVSKLPKA